MEPRLLALSPEARARLQEFAQEVEIEQRPDGALADDRAFASKSAEHAARLAGVLTLYEQLSARHVSDEMMRNAIVLMRHYLDEARRLTGGAGIAMKIVHAEKLRLWLIEKWPHDHISATDALQRGPLKRGFSAQDIRTLLELLASHDWLIREANGMMIDGQFRKVAWRVRRSKTAALKK